MNNAQVDEVTKKCKIEFENSKHNGGISDLQDVELLISKNKIAEAEELCYILLDNNRENFTLLIYLGQIKLLQKNSFEAEMFFENALRISPKNLTALKNLVDLNIEKKSLATALKYFIDLNLYSTDQKESKKYIEFFSSNLQGEQLSRFLKLMKFNEMVPTTFTIETALACDLKCPECAIGGGMISGRKKGYLKFEKFKTAFDKIKPYCEYLYLHLWGEPMLNKEIFEMIEYASEHTRTNISTNAQSLTPERIEKLITSGVAELIVSIDGFTQEVYEKYRVGGSVNKALDSLKLLAETNLKHGNRVSISPQFIVFEHNEHEVESFREFCQSLGLHPSFKAPYIRNDDSKFNFASNPQYWREQYNDEASLKSAMTDCINPKEVFTINLDGSVIICCHDYDKSTNFGNIYENEVNEIWNTPLYRKFRWDILNGKAPDFCVDSCMTYTKGKEYKSENEVVVEQPKIETQTEVKPEGKPEGKTNRIKINLCSGPRKLDGYVNIDITPNSDVIIDLEEKLLPFENNSVDEIVCMSAINYFSRKRAMEIVADCFRVLKDGGIARFGVQDLRILTQKYLDKDEKFFYEKLADGSDRFPGDTYADKFNEWFYGFPSLGKHCKYVYDFDSLAFLFNNAGFKLVEERNFNESRLTNVADIDNRPEQMFFLEAVKSEAVVKDETEEKFNSQNFDWSIEQSWQMLLEKLETNINDRDSLLQAAQLMINYDCWNHLINMLQKYLSVNTNDNEVKELFNEAFNKYNLSKTSQEDIVKNQNESLKLNQFNGEVQADEFHLEKAVEWLMKAFEATEGRGVSANYNLLEKKWNVAYPETTGYIIPTLVEFSNFAGNKKIAEYAKQMADWEISIQWSEGGIGEPVGVYGQKPRVFNTSQVMLGFLSTYQLTKDEKYLIAAIKAGNWLVNSQDINGSWVNNTYRGPRSYHIRTAWSLLELNKIVEDEKYLNAALRNIKYTLSLAEENGFINNTSLDIPEKPWTHLIAYTLIGMLETATIVEDESIKNVLMSLLKNAADNLSSYYINNRNMQTYPCFPGTFDKNWESNDEWSCITGDAQLEYFLRKMHRLTGNQEYQLCADAVLYDLKSIQILDTANGDKNLYGSLTGSYPVQGVYCTYNLPNWGVKFYADSLLQKLYNTNNYLG